LLGGTTTESNLPLLAATVLVLVIITGMHMQYAYATEHHCNLHLLAISMTFDYHGTSVLYTQFGFKRPGARFHLSLGLPLRAFVRVGVALPDAQYKNGQNSLTQHTTQHNTDSIIVMTMRSEI
jgi:hypothetical protein